MRKILIAVAVIALANFAWQRVSRNAPEVHADRLVSEAQPVESAEAAGVQVERPASEPQKYSCDGRVYCSQMTSCEEAMYFLQHCPGVQMDGEGDGVPCEKQWCGSRR